MQARSLKDLLQRQIAAYEQEMQNRWFRETGKKRAAVFKRRIAALIKREELSDLQLAWRMFSYIDMPHGHGPLETSTDLRLHLIKALCAYVDMDPGHIEAEAFRRQNKVVQAQMVAVGMTGTGGATYTFNEAYLCVARVHLKNALTQRSQQELRQPVTNREFTSCLLKSIREYQKSLQSNFCGGIKFGRRTGFKRAATLRDHISKDLCGTQGLSDQQILYRMYEYCKMDDGQGPLDTSKELRSNIINAMFKHLGLDMEPVYKEVNERLYTAMMLDTPTAGAAGLSLAMNARMYYDAKKLDMIQKRLRQGAAQELLQEDNSSYRPMMGSF